MTDQTDRHSNPWLERAVALSPLFQHADSQSWGGEDGVLRRLFSELPKQAGFAVEFGQRSARSGTVAGLVREQGWSALMMDLAAPAQTQQHAIDGGGTITLARECIAPSNINALFRKHGVPRNLDCLVIDVDGLDYWIWDALSAGYMPTLVVIEYNVHVGAVIEASIHADEAWSYGRDKNYGASFAALCALADRKGYRLVHVHGPWNLYFLRKERGLTASFCIPAPLDEASFTTLTDADAFYDTFCQGKRPSWHAAPAPDISRSPWQILRPPHRSQRVDIAGTALQVMADMHDARWYQQRKVYEERVSPLYRLLGSEGYGTLVDVGANVGMISIFARRAAPGLRLVCVEADPRLVGLLRRNLAQHGIDDADVVNAVAGSEDRPNVAFSLNPDSTLDNRVAVDRWPQIHVPMVRLDRLLAPRDLRGRIFIKIDTQGFELNVLRGLEAFLAARDDWLLKMEFAPSWLRSQGTDPLDVLDHLQSRYQFAEYAERIPYGLSGLDQLFAYPLAPEQHADFLRQVVSLNKQELGWVDLIVRPRPHDGSRAKTPAHAADTPAKDDGPVQADSTRLSAPIATTGDPRHELDRFVDGFQACSPQSLAEQAAKQRYFHDMQLPGVRTGTWVYTPDLPPNYHLFPVFRYLNELALTGAICLDIGTYDGMTAFSMAARGAGRVDSTCQFDLARFRIARALGGWRQIAYFPQTDLDDIHAEFGPASYDVVVMSAMLHHLLSPLEGLLEARRLLKPKGWLVLEVVVRNGHAAEMKLNPVLDDPVYGHPTIWVPSAEAVLGMLRLAGLAPRSQTLLIGTKNARETNYDRITVLAQAEAAEDVEGRTATLAELHRRVKTFGRHDLAPDFGPDAPRSAVAYGGPPGARHLNPWFEQPADPLQPAWTDPQPHRATFARIAGNDDFARLVAKHPDGAFSVSDLRHLPSRYPGQSMPEGMRWGLKQLGNLHVLDHVRDWGLVDVLEVGPGFNLYFPNHLPAWCRYTGLDDGGFYQEALLDAADTHRDGGRRVKGLLGHGNHGLAPSSFDACISVSVLEHVPAQEIERVCDEMYMLLRPGGWALHSIDLSPGSARTRGETWLRALRGAGFIVDEQAVNIDTTAVQALFTEPLSVSATFYSGYRSNIWGDHTLRARASPVTMLVAMRKP